VIVHHVDVPVNAPQVLAFSARAEALETLRRGLRDVYERADGRVLQSRWDEGLPGYREESERVAWEVDRAVMQRLLDDLREACRRAEAGLPRFHSPGPGDLDSLREACRVWAARLDAPVRVTPNRWFSFAPTVLFRLGPFLAGDGIPPMNFEWGHWARELEALATSEPEDHEPHPWSEYATEDVHRSLALFRSMTYHATHYDRTSQTETAGPAVPPDSLKNAMHDLVILADGQKRPPYWVWGTIESFARIRSHAALCVGPWQTSRGPGPFLGVPDAAERLVDPSGDLLGVFRVADEEIRWRSPRWWVLSGESIRRTLDQLPRQPTRWFADLGDAKERRTWGRAQRGGWIRWQAARSTWWPRCRDRYRQLLEEASREGRAVLFTDWIPDDQGNIAVPCGEELGRRCVVS
jgi:hypothetical protein